MISKNTILYVILSLLAATLNYLLYPILARVLPSAQYIDLTIALSLMTQASTFMAALTAVTIGLVKECGESNNPIVNSLQVQLVRFFSILGIVFLVISPLLFSLISISVVYSIPVITMILTSIPVMMLFGYLNGKQRLTSLGLATLFVACMQFITGFLAAIISQNGVITMFSMGLVQLLTLLALNHIFKTERLQISLPWKRRSIQHNNKPLLRFTIVASLSIVTVNILQVFDLLLMQRFGDHVAQTYTDFYIVSRIVFFLGMILVWPFLSTIRLSDARANRLLYLKMTGTLAFIGTSALIAMSLYGSSILTLLFSRVYEMQYVAGLVQMSILYKICFVIITAACLYATVLRRTTVLAIAFCSLVCISGVMAFPYSSPQVAMKTITVTSVLLAGMSSVTVLARSTVQKKATLNSL